jgi:NADH/F420H2 dehydrogenase subunit C
MYKTTGITKTTSVISPISKDSANCVGLAAYGKDLKEVLTDSIIGEAGIIKDELSITVQTTDIKKVLLYLRDHTYSKYEVLIDIVGVDYPSRKERFEVNYLLLSVRYNSRLIVKCNVDEVTPIDSVTDIYKAAGWHEREVYDLFGIYFKGHPDLRRILTDYGFAGHPLRKDFPLTGYTEVRYDAVEKRVLYEPVEVTQEFRSFNLVSPWSVAVTGSHRREQG